MSYPGYELNQYQRDAARTGGSDLAEENIDKLRKRYPIGFNTADSIARKDLEP